MKQKWMRIRFRANEDDPRPVVYPPMGPWWCSGYGDNYAIVVAYVRKESEVRKHWPEATEIDVMQRDCELTFSDRFPKPDWWKG